jgi:pyruvate dehydrogenase E2 component (dihydrolipoamide acetyltransferase)
MASVSDTVSVEVPDIGDFEDVPVIEILVSPGDTVATDDPLLTLESDKATMDVPAPFAGTIKEISVSVGDKVSQGKLLLTMEPADGAPTDGAEAESSKASAAASHGAPDEGSAPDAVATALEAEPPAPEAPASEAPAQPSDDGGPAAREQPTAASEQPTAASEQPTAGADGDQPVYASPSVRRLARERGVDLRQVQGTGRKGRITRDDVEGFVSRGPPPPAAAGPGLALDLPPWPSIDFEKFGHVERVTRSRIQRISAPNLARNWMMIPHVTHNDEADITDLEAWRRRLNEEHAKSGVKLTMVSFLVVASVATLKEFPNFNASLDGEELILKHYYNIGFAADTPGGLVVPVIKEADKKGLLDIARELTELSGKAREGKLAPGDMQGASFTISSLGGIGGTSFTPIINAPEVAILGATRSATKPVWNGGEFEPRLMLPLSLSYDHRVIDGAAAARFVVHLVAVLSDLRRALL